MTQPLTRMINASGQRNGSFRRKRQMAAIIHKQLFRLDCRDECLHEHRRDLIRQPMHWYRAVHASGKEVLMSYAPTSAK